MYVPEEEEAALAALADKVVAGVDRLPRCARRWRKKMKLGGGEAEEVESNSGPKRERRDAKSVLVARLAVANQPSCCFLCLTLQLLALLFPSPWWRCSSHC